MSRFDLDYHIAKLELAQPFTIARGTKKTVPNVIVKLSKNDITGYDEADPNKRYGEDALKVSDFLKQLPVTFFDDINTARQLAAKLDERTSLQSAKSAVEMAWWDWQAKKEDQPLWKRWNLSSNKTPATSYTIGLDAVEVMQQKVEAAEDYPILKVKLGTGRDREIITAIREVTGKAIRVDANEGWESLDEAKRQITFLADQNIELVEQPMPASMSAEMKQLKRWSPLPLMADESFKGDEDLNEVAQSFHGINIKLSKMGSLTKAMDVIQQARERKLEVMIGCMISSSLAIAAGALLGVQADYVDLDGHLLITSDPFEGLRLDQQKQVILSDRPGLGVSVSSGPDGG